MSLNEMLNRPSLSDEEPAASIELKVRHFENWVRENPEEAERVFARLESEGRIGANGEYIGEPDASLPAGSDSECLNAFMAVPNEPPF